MLSARRVSKEVQTTPLSTPHESIHRGIDTRELEENLRGLTVATQTEGELVGKEERRRSVIEVGKGEIKRERDSIPRGWELIWVEDPWTGKWEKIKVPHEEADYRRRKGLPQRPSYRGESEA